MTTTMTFPHRKIDRKTGREPFHDKNAVLGFDLLGFWQWAASDLVNNVLRGRLAEYLVAQALGIADDVRIEWNPYDLHTPDGLTIEVKCAAYIQSWAQNSLSRISFDIAPTHSWDALTNRTDTEARRQARVYVFALLSHRDKATIDPMDLSQWSFFVLPAAILNERFPTQQKIGLAPLLRLNPSKCPFSELRDTILRVAASASS